MKKLRCAVVGVGYLGKFHAEKYANLPNAELIGVCDTDPQNRSAIARQFKTLEYEDYKSLIGHVDAISLATPTKHHFDVAKFFLENHVHVLIEKPITTTVEEAEELIHIANKNKLTLQVGHLERFNPAVVALEGVLSEPQFIESHRLCKFNPRGTDVNVILDLMIHDIEIIQNINPSPITKIDAKGVPVLSEHADIANARVHFENGCVANVTASRVSLKNERKMRIFQPDTYISIDLQNKTFSTAKKGEGEMFPGIPNIETGKKSFKENDSLKLEIIAFLDAISQQTRPIVSGEDGKNALITALQISEAIKL